MMSRHWSATRDLALRRDQTRHEGLYLNACLEPRSAAWELVALYNLSKALDLAIDGAVSEEMEERFGHALRACLRADHYDLHNLICKLSATLKTRRRDNPVYPVTRPRRK